MGRLTIKSQMKVGNDLGVPESEMNLVLECSYIRQKGLDLLFETKGGSKFSIPKLGVREIKINPIVKEKRGLWGYLRALRLNINT